MRHGAEEKGFLETTKKFPLEGSAFMLPVDTISHRLNKYVRHIKEVFEVLYQTLFTE